MKTAIILHGMPYKKDYYNPNADAESNCHWLPWLQHELIIRDILAQNPELPKPYEPVYEDWKKVFEQFIIDEETILVGHSCGAGFLVRWLSENDKKVGKVVLVAPWIDVEKSLKTGMFNFKIDPGMVKKTKGITVFYSDNEDQCILDSVNKILETVNGAKGIEMKNMGHFVFRHMGKREFPELLEEALK